jgi:6-hydroxycyclohex-1-ene-1-carbonyl-CoA dehydrogenase
VHVKGWTVEVAQEPMRLLEREEEPGPGEALVEVAGCGVCHTDLGFYYDGVPTRHPLPLTLGHEVSGKVVEVGEGAESWPGTSVVVPAVIPCGECEACRAGKGSICPKQIFPGNDVHGGFGTHLRVPARGLCPVPDLSDAAINPNGLDLSTLSVIADAVSTPYQAIERSGLEAGGLAVFVGVGGVGGFGVQIAAARGATVVAIDVDADRLERMREYGADHVLDASSMDPRALKKAVRVFASERGIPTWRTAIFECSGTTAGQETSYALVGHGSYLSIVGFTPGKVTLRLSNLMAFDAMAEGNWGCLPELYPAVLELVLSGKVDLPPFVEHRPMATINETFAELHDGGTACRVILVPES